MGVGVARDSSDCGTGESELGRLGLPQDWSHRHVVFSNPPTLPILLAIRQDPRLLHQWLKFNAHGRINRQAAQEPEVSDRARDPDSETEKGVDWSATLGGWGTKAPGCPYRAKYTLDINARPEYS